MAKQTKRVAWAVAALAATTVLVVRPLFRYFDLSPFNDQPFDRRIWLVAPERIKQGIIQESDNPRGRMVQDLLDHYLRPRMRRDQVAELLGAPDGRLTAKDFVPEPGTQVPAEALEYSLGYWSGFRVDLDVLRIGLDKSGRVIGAWVIQF